MVERFPWKTALKIAWRESRASSARFLFVIFAVALGVGALTGVRGFSESFRAMLVRDARKLLAGDLSARTFALNTPEQDATLADLEKKGVQHTWLTESVSMLSTGEGSTPVLVSVKAVQPGLYPFYGELKLSPPQPLTRALTPDTIATSEDLLVRLDLKLGDTVKIGAAYFRVAALVVTEPDRMAGSLNVGPRILMSREAFDRTELLVPGARAAERYLFRLSPNAIPVQQVRNILRNAFPDALVIDYRESHPLITRGLDRSTKFLSLVSLIALIVGALGVAMAMHSHLQQKMDSIAVMKSLGARSSQIMRIYTVQTLMLGMLGGTAGVAVGLLVQRIFPILIARYFHLDPGVHWDPFSAAQGLAVGVLTTLLFTLPPLLSIRRIRPSLILRREMMEAQPGWRDRLRNGKAVIAVTALILTGMLGIVWWLSESARTAVFFVGGFTAAIVILSVIASAMLHGLRRAARWTQQALPAAFRHGLANIYRPGNQAAALLVALGLGVMFTLSVYLVQKSMLVQIASSAPPGMPNVFFINITPQVRDGVAELLRKHPGVRSGAEVIPVVSARLTRIDGVPAVDARPSQARRLRRSRSVTYNDNLPPQTEVREGAFWKAGAAVSNPYPVCVAEGDARELRLHVGDLLDWSAGGHNIATRVACIYRSDSVRIGSNFDFLFHPEALKGVAALHFAAARVDPVEIARLQKASFKQFPTVTVINGADVLAIIQEVVDQIALVIRFISFFSILAGGIILASSVAGTRFRRVREVVILKTLGATRSRIAQIFSVEFSILGLVAGILGSVLATGFSLLVLKRLFEVDYRFDLLPHLISIACTTVLANLAGWLASHRILGQKPLEALRDNL